MAEVTPTVPEQGTPAVTAQSRYEQLVTERNPFLDLARECAALTIPSLLPPDGSDGTNLPQPYQSVGADGVNNLAAKILLTLLPPGLPFFRLAPDEKAIDELVASAGDGVDVRGEIEKALAKYERQVTRKLESRNTRAVLFEALKHLIHGNVLLVILPSAGLKYFPLSQYVCNRDLEGNPIEIVVKEQLSHKTLPPKAYAIVVQKQPESLKDSNTSKSFDLYTWLTRKQDGSWRVHQEIMGERIPGTEGSYPKDKQAYLPLRWNAIAGANYGIGRAVEYLGDLNAFESLSASLIDGAAAAAKMLFMVDEAGVTSKKKIAHAKNLDVIDGRASDVSVLRVDKHADFTVAKATADEVKQRLERAFLLTSSIQRDAERVTAEEIRTLAAELEQSLGGIYSILAQELQRPLVIRVLHLMTRARELKPLPEGVVEPQIVTGIEGLGRTSELIRLDRFIAELGAQFGPEAVSDYIPLGAYATRKAAALQLDVDGLIRSEEQVQAMRQQRMASQLASSLGPNAIKAQSDQAIAASQQQAAQAAEQQ
jgi:hypothetical protein